MFYINVQVKPSPVHGNGLFTAEPVSAGTTIYQGNADLDLIISEEKFSTLDAAEQQFISHYGAHSRQDQQWHLAHDHIRFCNHSNDPNVTLSYPDANSHSCQIVAVCDINAGEELLQDYREFEELRACLQ
ncbi:SET domain-containing protein-lysine N-methyltransferase [Endozoicomonas atrinae]|uniref:SET domain-containing protein-lysine N-methyltransferase n=1 Tax=Endozoicomonas atrinae TaxID=1333660 RepID=UPI000825405F|nr:SET domain-containing protein [Endozoicomonas atrinae]